MKSTLLNNSTKYEKLQNASKPANHLLLKPKLHTEYLTTDIHFYIRAPKIIHPCTKKHPCTPKQI